MSEWTGEDEENCGDGERVSVRKVRDLDNTAKERMCVSSPKPSGHVDWIIQDPYTVSVTTH